jgi:hypothetical protein
MNPVKFEKLKNNNAFTEDIRWEVTPKIFLDPGAGPGDEPVDLTHGYMLYVDLVNDRPALVIMMLKRIVSKTVGFTFDIPEDLLRDSMNCASDECIQGMHPLSEKLEKWLKKECGLAC